MGTFNSGRGCANGILGERRGATSRTGYLRRAGIHDFASKGLRSLIKVNVVIGQQSYSITGREKRLELRRSEEAYKR